MKSIDDYCKEIHAWAVAKGWFTPAYKHGGRKI